MRRTKRKLNRRNVLATLAIVSLVGVLLPASITSRLISLVQVVLPFQDWATRGVEAVEDLGGVAEKPVVAPADVAALRRENAALQHRLATLAARYDDLEREHREVTQIRHRGLSGGRLVPARTVAADAVAWRESRLINAGALSGVQRLAAVTSNHFTVRADEGEALQDGLAVLAGEALVGFVEQVGTHSARVVLLTDRTTEMKVLVSRQADGQYHPLDAEFWLVGTGRGLLEIRDVDHRYLRAETIRVGDVVLSSPTDPRLPAAMTIGTVTKIRPDQENGLLYVLEVAPALKPGEIRRVYVVDPGSGWPGE